MRLITGGIGMVLVLVTSAPGLAADAAETEDTPAAFFERRLEETENQTRTFDGIPPNLEMIEDDFGKGEDDRIFLRIDRPTVAVDLTQWSDRPRGDGVLPLYWNPQRHQFEVVRSSWCRPTPSSASPITS